MKLFFKENRLVLFFLFFLITALLFVLFTNDKLALHLQINSYVNQWNYVDVFFKYITHLGDGLFVLILSIIILFFNIRLGIALVSAYALASLISTTLKHWVFEAFNRPYFIFQWEAPHHLNLVDGVDMYIHNAFPSGHATAAFVFFIVLSIYFKANVKKVACLLLACIAAFSRVYLSQHFLMDITAGAFLGSTIAILISYFFFYKNGKGLFLNLSRRVFTASK
jgi:membrane-associated phospholipid phosphatase